ncbi:MAG TPA: sialidase family protein [Gemmataceae bacterium]|nr:sialidase family protein [Gemmataceae bacterium]
MVENNQELHLLKAAGVKGKIDVPDWLKVYYRKQHPQLKAALQDPTQGYPLALESIYHWMLTHQDLRPSPPLPPPARAHVADGNNIRISGAQNTPRSESDIRVNFNAPKFIIAASNAIAGDGRQAQFYSMDGGASWGQTSLPLVENDQFMSDPTVDWTSDGTAWATTIGIEGASLRMRSYRSLDHGVTWAFDKVFSGTQTDADKQMMWVDHGATSPYKDNIYVIWHNGQPAFVNRRTGPAGNWQTPLQVSGAETTGTAIGSDIKTNSAGDVLAFWPDTGSQTAGPKLFVSKSTDGGASFSAPVKIADTYGSFQVAVPAFASRQALIGISGGAYRTDTKNLLYASWMDLTGADGCKTPNDQPGTNPMSACKTRIWFSRSVDGGPWEAPQMINNQASLNDQFNQKLAVDETNGTLVVVYYDSIGDANRKKVNLWYQTSSNDGVTWSPAVKVATAPTDETTAGADSGNQFGDYNGLSGYAGVFFPSWTDRRSGGPEEIWTAALSIGPINVASLPKSLHATFTTGTKEAANQPEVQWSRVVKPSQTEEHAGESVIYQFHGVDRKGHPCTMLVEVESGRVIEFVRDLSYDEAKTQLPERVTQGLQKALKDRPDFQPTLVQEIYRDQKLALYAFKTGAPKKESLYLRADTGELLSYANKG